MTIPRGPSPPSSINQGEGSPGELADRAVCAAPPRWVPTGAPELANSTSSLKTNSRVIVRILITLDENRG